MLKIKLCMAFILSHAYFNFRSPKFGWRGELSDTVIAALPAMSGGQTADVAPEEEPATEKEDAADASAQEEATEEPATEKEDEDEALPEKGTL